MCVEPAEGETFCAEPCEAAGDCDLEHTCVLDLGACLEVCAPAGPGCPEGEACVAMGQVNACALEASP
ncbi:MAG: hypothetical protein EKK62_16530 [Acidimicrobiia bacterium]|nr:MAG: hypothetical protein EKK62_16530 [Acidimicrobiia bacterium]